MNNQKKIIVAGFGGQGIVAIGSVISRACVVEGKNVTTMVSYGAEMRGGTANSSVIVSDDEIASPIVTKPDIAIVMNHPSLERFEPTVEPGGLVVVNESMAHREVNRGDLEKIYVPATDIANELGNLKVGNIVILGALIKHAGLLKMESVEQGLRELFGAKKPELVELNIKALHAGAERSRYEAPQAVGA